MTAVGRARHRATAVSDIAIMFAILLAVVVAFVSNRIPVGIVAIGASLSLYFTGVLDLDQALAGSATRP